MDIASLIDALGRAEAYPHPTGTIEIRQTHISVVALAGEYAYKVKKPVNLGFLDFTTLEKRFHWCREEVRLNRRLAPAVYLDVVPIVRAGGRVAVGGGGPPLEYAVMMRRLPDDATLLRRLERDEVGASDLMALGHHIATFHLGAESGPEIDGYGRWPVVAANARENLTQSRSQVGECLSHAVCTRLGQALEEALEAHRPLIEHRAAAHFPRDTHGDLHLDHVYVFADGRPSRDFVIVDCIEFNERFRYADPVADMAFLVMDLLFRGRWDLAEPFIHEYFRTTGDSEGRRLLAFYVAYRAAVRAKVGGMVAEQAEVPEEQRARARRTARGHWLLALSELESPWTRPGLVLIGGLPGTGKTTLAMDLARGAGFRVISADRVRKELSGLDPEAPAPAEFGKGLYTSEWNDRTYAACLDKAEALLFEGERVIVDASFREAKRRRVFRDAATTWGVRSLFLVCSADPEVVRARLSARGGGVSDADWAIHVAASAAWEPSGYRDPRWQQEVQAGDERSRTVEQAIEHLRAVGLAGP